MRLGQLSRKLQVKTAEIIDFLQSEYDVTMNNHPNSKVPEVLVAHLESRFKKEIVLESTAEREDAAIEEYEIVLEVPKTETSNDSEIQESPLEELEKVVIIENTSNYNNNIVEEEAELNIVDGIIKAPKIEFAGVKVVGKIELPEKKIEAPKETLIEEGTLVDSNNDIDNSEKQENKEPTEIIAEPINPEQVEQKRKSRPSKTSHSERKNRYRRNDQPLLTPEEQRRIKLKEAQKLKLEAQKAKKENRRETYSQELKPSKNNSSSQKKKKIISNKTPKKQKPTSLWGRFIYWLND